MADEEDLHRRETARPEERESQFPRVDKVVRETVRKAFEKGLEAGLGTLTKTDEALRGVVGEGKLGRELVGMALGQVEETKNALVRVVAREVREFLEATDLAKELQKALTSLSFEIKTEIRFIPNDAGDGVKPEVKADLSARRTRPPSAAPPPPDEHGA